MKRKPSPASILALVALVAALAGTASALPGRNTVDGSDIKPESVKRSDLADGTLGPRGETPVAANPSSASDPCDEGVTAVFCGASGSEGHWENVGGSYASVTFFTDASGVVHLGGTAVVTSPSNLGRLFILPAGMRPDDGDRAFNVPCGVPAQTFVSCLLVVDEDGVVYQPAGQGLDGISLDGVTFPAG